jgi:archaellum biogenesis ATPase FlaH
MQQGRDKKGDNLIRYHDGGAYCFGCGYYERSDAAKAEELMALDFEEQTKKPISKADVKSIVAATGFDYTRYRGISQKTREFFRVRTAYDEEGNVTKTFYPVTADGKITGYKIRNHPKRFESVGITGKQCDLFGEHLFTGSEYNSWVLICAGEEDAQAAWEMIESENSLKGKEYKTACVSPTIGESGAAQLAKRYEFLNKFNKILLVFDNDKAGIEATEKALRVLPKGKVWLVDLPKGKDSNQMLQEGRANEFIRALFKAQRYVPVGILGSDGLFSRVLEEAMTPKIPLPPFCPKLSRMMAGGIPLGRIVNIGAKSGAGKTSLINEFIYFWIFNSPHKPGIVTMELSAGQYGQDLLSRHIKRKISLIEDDREKLDFLHRNEEAAKELFTDADGNPRFNLVDDRDGTIDDLKALVEELVVSCECKLIILDPLQDVLDGLGNEEQSTFMKWQKSMVKSHNVTFININHLRKSSGPITEEDFSGSSTIFKSGAANLIMERNKDAEDDIEKNTTNLDLKKCRWTGRTGKVDQLFYEIETHTIYNLDYYLEHVYEPEDGTEIIEGECDEVPT